MAKYPHFSKRGFMNTSTLKNDTSNALVQHRNIENHNIEVKGAKIIKLIPNKKKRLTIESAVILLTKTIKRQSEEFQLSLTLAQLIIMEHDINK